MLIICFVFCFCFLLFGVKKMRDYETEEFGFYMTVFSSLAMLVIVIFLFFNIDIVVKSNVLYDKISLYEAENVEIENQINSLVQKYMDYEKEMYSDLKGDDGISLISLYPNLKSDELIKEQIKIYHTNKQEIKCLKSKLLDVKANKWWLYFGK